MFARNAIAPTIYHDEVWLKQGDEENRRMSKNLPSGFFARIVALRVPRANTRPSQQQPFASTKPKNLSRILFLRTTLWVCFVFGQNVGVQLIILGSDYFLRWKRKRNELARTSRTSQKHKVRVNRSMGLALNVHKDVSLWRHRVSHNESRTKCSSSRITPRTIPT